MKGLIQVEFRAVAFSNTPILQKRLSSLPSKPLKLDLAQPPAHRAYGPEGEPGFL